MAKNDTLTVETNTDTESVSTSEAEKLLKPVHEIGGYITSAKAAELLGGIRVTKANYLATHGKIKAVQFGGIIAFDKKSVEAYIPEINKQREEKTERAKTKALLARKRDAIKAAKQEIERKLQAGEL